MMNITSSEYDEISKELNVDPNIIKTVAEVESSGGGFDSKNRPKILFEGHKFYNFLKKKLGQNKLDELEKNNPDIIYPKWTKKYYKGGDGEYDRLNRAIVIDEESALKSASWGAFQILGENFKECGCKNVFEFVEKSKKSEYAQLCLFCEYIKTRKLDSYLRNKDWAGFARRYNGPLYSENSYDEKLRKVYNKLSKN